MTGFWEAVDRAALGQPGAASPRPRSLFEMDDSPGEGLDALYIETDAHARRDIAEPPRTASAPRAAAPAAPPIERAQTVDVPREHDAGSTVSREVEPVAGQTNGPAASAPGVASAAMPNAVPPLIAPYALERVEVHRSEVLQGVDATLAPHAAEPRNAPDLAPVPQSTARPAQATPIALTIAPLREDEPMPVNARPLAPPPEPAGVAAEAATPAQPLVIQIDRIEVRIEPQHAATSPAPRERDMTPAVSLDEYLGRQAAGER
ncbi:hypothetical protein [Paraburkholderia caribensis]|uniref:hypothetical protein n=1 Tax=Paraburkholderia caribensis TaxID=75105 RepID=UPI001D066584|nr:hypothetical protein [Paraburkholderia caribensis]